MLYVGQLEQRNYNAEKVDH